ncbi:MAG TPA: radical SAM protein, partial [Sumerlaeia bacterium]|nr:radical SAM protein [Sumerlaeia bacterium]
MRRLRCLLPFYRVEINAGSRVTPCCDLWFRGHMGRLTESALDEVWNSERFQALRAEMCEGGNLERFCRESTCPHLRSGVWYDVDDALPLPRPLLEDVRSGRTQLSQGPSHVKILNDFRCNFRCIMCSASGRPKEKGSDALELLEKLEGNLSTVECLELLGSGELFAIPGLCDYLERFENERYPRLGFNLETNGNLLTPRMWERIAHLRIDYVNVSIDAATRETYERIRRGGDWSVLMRNLEFLVGKQNEGAIKELQINMVVMRSNRHEIAAFARMGVEMGVGLTFYAWVYECPNEVILESKDWKSLQIIDEQLQDPILSHPRVDADAIRNWRSWVLGTDASEEDEGVSASISSSGVSEEDAAGEDHARARETLAGFVARAHRPVLGRFHRDILGRAARREELDRWQERLGRVLAGKIDGRFIPQEIGRRLFASEEYARRGRSDEEFIRDCCKGLLARAPSEGEIKGRRPSLETCDRWEIVGEFLESAEFWHAAHASFRGGEDDPVRSFLARIYLGALDQCWDCGDLDYWTDELTKARDFRQKRKRIVNLACSLLATARRPPSPSSSEDLAVRLYRALLARFPERRERLHWASKLESG